MKKPSQKPSPSYGDVLDIQGKGDLRPEWPTASEGKDFIRDVLGSLSAHISVVDRSGHIIAVNHSWQRFSHENGEPDARKTGTGANYLDTCRRSAAGGDSLAAEAAKGIQKVLNGEAPAFYLEYPCHSPEQDRWFMMRVTPLVSSIEGAVIAHEDITQRKLAEIALQKRLQEIDFLHRLTKAANQASDMSSLIREVVNLAMEFTGFPSGAIYLLSPEGQSAALFHGVNLPDGVARSFQKVEAGQQPFSRVFLEGLPLEYDKHKEQGPEPLRLGPIEHFISLPIFHREKVIGALNLASEKQGTFPGETVDLLMAASRQLGSVITKMRSEEQLKHYARQLEHSNNELQEFAYISSHDLQEPLRKIQTFASRLKLREGERLSESGQEYLDRMQHAAFRMQSLIRGLLGYSRITTRARPFEQVDLNEVIQEVLSDLEVAIEESGAYIEVGPLPVIEADPTQMRQLLQNLLSNALRFHKPDSPPKVRVTAGASGQKEWVELAVKDDGIGFNEKYLDRIFGLFQRLEGRKYEGSGIGLAVCKKIAERHGGRITAQSTPGEGASFQVFLPIHQTGG